MRRIDVRYMMLVHAEVEDNVPKAERNFISGLGIP